MTLKNQTASEIQGEKLKGEVREFWNRQACDTHIAEAPKFTRDYFEEIESFRYSDQPCIHAFAQFPRYHGKRVLEVGVGAGTDFIQWLRAGAKASGIDLTQEAVDHVGNRVQIYGLPAPEKLLVGDAENLPFPSDTFDLGYSFGVLHHSADTEKAISELVRVVRPGGEVKIMLYNSRSICAINAWVKHALLGGKPWKSLAWALWHHVESVGTKAYTCAEVARIFSALPLTSIRVQTEITSADTLASSRFRPLNLAYHLALWMAGNKYPWKLADYSATTRDYSPEKSTPPQFFGHPLGWFHCISARKQSV